MHVHTTQAYKSRKSEVTHAHTPAHPPLNSMLMQCVDEGCAQLCVLRAHARTNKKYAGQACSVKLPTAWLAGQGMLEAGQDMLEGGQGWIEGGQDWIEGGQGMHLQDCDVLTCCKLSNSFGRSQVRSRVWRWKKYTLPNTSVARRHGVGAIDAMLPACPPQGFSDPKSRSCHAPHIITHGAPLPVLPFLVLQLGDHGCVGV